MGRGDGKVPGFFPLLFLAVTDAFTVCCLPRVNQRLGGSGAVLIRADFPPRLGPTEGCCSPGSPPRVPAAALHPPSFLPLIHFGFGKAQPHHGRERQRQVSSPLQSLCPCPCHPAPSPPQSKAPSSLLVIPKPSAVGVGKRRPRRLRALCPGTAAEQTSLFGALQPFLRAGMENKFFLHGVVFSCK